MYARDTYCRTASINPSRPAQTIHAKNKAAATRRLYVYTYSISIFAYTAYILSTTKTGSIHPPLYAAPLVAIAALLPAAYMGDTRLLAGIAGIEAALLQAFLLALTPPSPGVLPLPLILLPATLYTAATLLGGKPTWSAASKPLQAVSYLAILLAGASLYTGWKPALLASLTVLALAGATLLHASRSGARDPITALLTLSLAALYASTTPGDVAASLEALLLGAALLATAPKPTRPSRDRGGRP